LAAGLCFLLYIAVLLRVRGNITIIDGKWRLQFVPRGESWRLHIGRDTIDSSMLKVAAHMVWYPVAYSVVLVPISLTRLTEFAGHVVPFWAIVLSDIVFSMMGFVNVVLLLLTTRLIPDTSALPELTTERKNINSSSTEAMGYTPYVLPALFDLEAEAARWSGVMHSSPAYNNRYLQQSHSDASRESRSSTSTDLTEYLKGSQHSDNEGKRSRFSEYSN